VPIRHAAVKRTLDHLLDWQLVLNLELFDACCSASHTALIARATARDTKRRAGTAFRWQYVDE
jgi:hypothetical protein